MLNFNVGAMRPANGDVRIAAANELVQRTLAQHGLLPNGGAPLGDAQTGMAGMQGLLARFQSPLDAPAPSSIIPEGATFERAQHSCAAGSRAYRSYVPASASEGVSGIIVMLHGCTQSPEDFATGTGMNALAEQHGFVVIYPHQSRGDNAQSCWNWFSRGDQQRDRGEPAILAGMAQQAMAQHGVSRDRTFVAGLSAGAAMAVILGETYPDVFAGVGAHSGLPFGAAKDVPSAFAAMAGGAPDVSQRPKAASPVPTIIFHGSADATVAPVNGERIARDTMDLGPRQSIDSDEQGHASGRQFSRKTVTDSDGVTVLEHWVVGGLGHAWSGGQPQGSYTDAKGPEASAEMVRFFFHLADKKA